MKQKIVVFMVSTIFIISSSATSNALEFTTKNVTDNAIEDDAPQINSSGQLAWHGFDGNDNEIFFFDGSETHQLTDNDHDDNTPHLSENGRVAWFSADDNHLMIYLYDGAATKELARNPYTVYNTETLRLYGIDNNGWVAWGINLMDEAGEESAHIGYSDGDDTRQIPLTENTSPRFFVQNDNGPMCLHDVNLMLLDGRDVIDVPNSQSYFGDLGVNNLGQMVWVGDDGVDYEVYLYDGEETIQLTNNNHNYDKRPMINNKGQVVWASRQDRFANNEIHLYNGKDSTMLADDRGVSPVLNDNGQVAWLSEKSVKFWEGGATKEIFSGAGNIGRGFDETSFQINSHGHVAWLYSDGTNYEVFLFDGATTTQLTDNEVDEVDLQLNDNGQLLWRASIDSDHEIFVATYEPGQNTEGDNNDSDDEVDENVPASPSGGGGGSGGCFIMSAF